MVLFLGRHNIVLSHRLELEGTVFKTINLKSVLISHYPHH